MSATPPPYWASQLETRRKQLAQAEHHAALESSLDMDQAPEYSSADASQLRRGHARVSQSDRASDSRPEQDDGLRQAPLGFFGNDISGGRQFFGGHNMVNDGVESRGYQYNVDSDTMKHLHGHGHHSHSFDRPPSNFWPTAVILVLLAAVGYLAVKVDSLSKAGVLPSAS